MNKVLPPLFIMWGLGAFHAIAYYEYFQFNETNYLWYVFLLITYVPTYLYCRK